MLSAIDRVILAKALATGFVSDRELTETQTRHAPTLIARKLLSSGGREGDGTQVYRITQQGRQAYGARL